jgi:hypothetical protein
MKKGPFLLGIPFFLMVRFVLMRGVLLQRHRAELPGTGL